MSYCKVMEKDIPLCGQAFVSLLHIGSSSRLVYPNFDSCQDGVCLRSYIGLWRLQERCSDLVDFLNTNYGHSIDKYWIQIGACDHDVIYSFYNKFIECIDTGNLYQPVYLDGEVVYTTDNPELYNYKVTWSDIHQVYDKLGLPYFESHSCITKDVIDDLLQVSYCLLGACCSNTSNRGALDIIADPELGCDDCCNGTFLMLFEADVNTFYVEMKQNCFNNGYSHILTKYFYINGEYQSAIWHKVDLSQFDDNKNYICPNKRGLLLENKPLSRYRRLVALYYNSPPYNHYYFKGFPESFYLYGFRGVRLIQLTGGGPWSKTFSEPIYIIDYFYCRQKADYIELYFDTNISKYRLKINYLGAPVFGRDLIQISTSGYPGCFRNFWGVYKDILLVFEEGFYC